MVYWIIAWAQVKKTTTVRPVARHWQIVSDILGMTMFNNCYIYMYAIRSWLTFLYIRHYTGMNILGVSWYFNCFIFLFEVSLKNNIFICSFQTKLFEIISIPCYKDMFAGIASWIECQLYTVYISWLFRGGPGIRRLVVIVISLLSIWYDWVGTIRVVLNLISYL